jgi:hypothetical protein
VASFGDGQTVEEVSPQPGGWETTSVGLIGRWRRYIERSEAKRPPRPNAWCGITISYLVLAVLAIVLGVTLAHGVAFAFAALFILNSLFAGWRWRRDRAREVASRPG